MMKRGKIFATCLLAQQKNVSRKFNSSKAKVKENARREKTSNLFLPNNNEATEGKKPEKKNYRDELTVSWKGKKFPYSLMTAM
jgi:hypothetical protein